MFSTLAMFSLLPLMPRILDFIIPLNESRPIVYTIPVKYGDLQMENYYFSIMLHADASSVIAISTIIAADTIYCFYVQHACGIFTMLG